MAGFSNFAAITAARDAGKILRSDFVSSVPATLFSGTYWTRPGSGAAAGTPGTQVINSGFFFPDTSTDRKIITKFCAVVSGQSGFTSGTLMLFDRLVEVGGISFTSTGDKTVASAALPRYTDGVGVYPWLEFSTSMGGADAFAGITLNSYTNQAATSGRNNTDSVVLPTEFNQGIVTPLMLLSGDTGVQAVSTINVADAASAGAANLVLIKPLLYLPVVADTAIEIDPILELNAFLRVYDGASLGVYVFSNSVNTATIVGHIELVYG